MLLLNHSFNFSLVNLLIVSLKLSRATKAINVVVPKFACTYGNILFLNRYYGKVKHSCPTFQLQLIIF